MAALPGDESGNARATRLLLERESELLDLHAALTHAASGHGETILIAGPAGIGKTSLVRAALERGPGHGFTCLAARGSDLEQGFAFGVVSQLFSPAIAAADAAERDFLLSGAASLATPALLLEAPRETAPAGGVPGTDAAFPILHGLYWLTANIATRSPLLLAVDDAHWADHPSLRFLGFLAARVGDLPVAVVLALRPGEGEAEGEVLQALQADAGQAVLHATALSQTASAEVVRTGLATSVPADVIAAAHDVTGGNPFLLTELVAELRASGTPTAALEAESIRELAPEAVSRSVVLRLARLPGGATELARALAVLGDDSSLSHIAELAGLDRTEAGELADALTEHDIVRAGLPLSFKHPLVRAAIYSDLRPAERAAAHAHAARLLLRDGAPPERIATHLMKTDPPFGPAATDVLRDAASAALARGMPEAGVGYLRRALAEPYDERTGRTLVAELGVAELRAGDPAASEHLREACESADSAAERALHAGNLAQAMLWAGRPAEGARLLEEAVAVTKSEHPQLAAQLEAGLLSMGYWDKSLLKPTRARAEALRWEAIGGDTPAERALLAALVVSRALPGDSATVCRELAERALAGGRLLTELTPDAPIYWSVLVICVYCEAFEVAAEHIAAGLASARANGSLYAFAMGSSIATVLALRRGDVFESIAHAESCLEAASHHGVLAVLPTALAYLIDALVQRGELERCVRLLAEYGFHEGELPDTSALFPMLLFNRGRLRLARGELHDGVEDLLEVEERRYAWDFTNPCAQPAASMAAVAMAQLGDAERAIQLAEKDLGLARRWGTPGATGAALRALGLAEGGERGIEILAEAVRELERSPLRLELAGALVDYGAALRRANHRSDSREPLRRGHELAQEFGASPLAERARTELAATGARPRNVVRTGIDELTPSERRIARMAAEGMSNPEIAQALFVTTKTVEMHLGNAYRKLGIHSRTKLPEALKRRRTVKPPD